MTTSSTNQFDILIDCLVTSIADSTGEASTDKLADLVNLQGIDLNALQAQVAALNAALASNTSGDQLTAQSILSQLGALDSRLDSSEAVIPQLGTLAAAVSALQAGLAAEQARAEAAEAGLQAAIDAHQAAIDSLSASIVAIQNGGNQEACDCAALTAAIAAQATAIAGLEASDAAQSVQLAALATRVEALEVAAAGIAQAQAAAQAAAAAAAAAAASAAAAQAAAAGAQAEVDALEAVVAANAASQSTINNTFVTKVEISGVDCAVHGATYRNVLRGKMGLALGQSNGSGNNG